MADIASLYPPAPDAVPADLTAPSRVYRARVVIVLLCLIVFVGTYLGLTVGSVVTCYYCFSELAADEPPTPYTPPASSTKSGQYPRTSTPLTASPRPPRETKPVFGLIVGGVISALLCLFLVKGLFKRSRAGGGVRVEVTEKEQPALFAFIRKLCTEVGAPFPHKVFVVPEVNAAVSFDDSFLNLVFPSRKNLLIGLALVNRLNLSEFKAVLAHEFGHFSQNSMKLGSYVYTANRVVAEVVYGRDQVDDLLDTLRRTDIRIAIFAWTFTGILWVMRKALELLYRGINFAHVALSRQMEYNADLVAVRAAGSDALTFALARLDFAGDAFGQTWTDLTAAADHGRFTRDIYYHHTKAAEYLRARRNDPTLGGVPALPEDPNETVQVFKPEDLSVPAMWATHPANHDRESNIKVRYVRSPVDERSPWLLFDDVGTVREAVTRAVYLLARKTCPKELEDPEAIQAFIDAEHAEITYSLRYHGLYDNRYIKPGDLAELTVRAAREEFDDLDKLAAAHNALYGPDLKDRTDGQKARNEESGKLNRLREGAAALTGTDFEHRGRRYRRTDVERLLKEVDAETDRYFESVHSLDRNAFRVHYAMAVQLGETDAAELERWYRFQLGVQELHSTLVGWAGFVQSTMAGMAGKRQVPEQDFQNALAVLRQAHETLRLQLRGANELLLPPLTNMTAGEPLGPFLLTDPLLDYLPTYTNSLDGAWVQQLLNQTGEVIDKAARVLFKSLGGLLALQEQLAERWTAARTPVVTAETNPVPNAVE